MQQRRQPIDAATPTRGQPRGQAPWLRRQFLAQNLFRERQGQQDPVAGDEPARFGQPPMGRNEVLPRDAVAVQEDAVVALATRR